MVKSSHRRERVATLIQQTLAETISRQMKDPRIGFVTVTHVRVTADLAWADVFVSPMGNEEEKRAAMEGLGRAKGFLRSQLASSLRIKTVPDLRFHLDRGVEHAARIAELLDDSSDEAES